MKILNALETACLGGGILSVLVLMLLTNVDVILRKSAGFAIPGLYEITEDYLMVALVFLSISYVQKKGGHVRVTLFLKYIPKRFLFTINKIIDALALSYFSLIAGITWQAGIEAWEFNAISSSNLAYPLAPAIFLVCFGCGITSLRILLSLFGLCSETAKASRI